jgi:hypothetical protein
LRGFYAIFDADDKTVSCECPYTLILGAAFYLFVREMLT